MTDYYTSVLKSYISAGWSLCGWLLILCI